MDHNYQLTGNNILLKPLKPEHLELVRTWRNQDDIRTSFISQHIISPEQQLLWYEAYLSKKDDLMFIIAEREDQLRPIGTLALYHIDFVKRTAEFGRLMIGDHHTRGRGIGREAVSLVCQFGIDTLGLRDVDLYVFKENKAAIRIYKKCGFKCGGLVRRGNMFLLHMRLQAGRRSDIDSRK